MAEEVPAKVFRRLQRVGRATYSISLPKKWVISRGLRPGDLLELGEELDGSLRVAPIEIRPRLSSCTINAELCRDSRRLAGLILSSYRAGYDSIRITFSKRTALEILKDLEKLLHQLPGLEVTKETDSEIELQYILDYGRYPLDDLIRRSQMLLSAIFNNLIDFLETRRYELISYIRSLRNRLREIRQLFTRLIITYLKRREIGRFLRPRSATHIHSSIVLMHVIEYMAEDLITLGEMLPKLKKKIWANPRIYHGLRRLLEYSSQLFDETLNAYFSLDFDRASRVLEISEDELASALDEIVREKPSKDYEFNLFTAQASTFLRNFIRRCHEISQLILDIFIELENLICKIEK